MTSEEFIGVIEQAERFYDKKLAQDQRTIWYESFKYMGVSRFKFLVSEWYRKFDYFPSLAKALSLDQEIGYAETKPKLKEVVKCDICQGKGFVCYYEVHNGYQYRFVARCNCLNASEYMKLPSLAQVGLEEAELLRKRKVQKEKAQALDVNEIKNQIKKFLGIKENE